MNLLSTIVNGKNPQSTINKTTKRNVSKKGGIESCDINQHTDIQIVHRIPIEDNLLIGFLIAGIRFHLSTGSRCEHIIHSLLIDLISRDSLVPIWNCGIIILPFFFSSRIGRFYYLSFIWFACLIDCDKFVNQSLKKNQTAEFVIESLVY